MQTSAVLSPAPCAAPGSLPPNDDGSFPTPEGPWPATGAIVVTVHAATGRRPIIVGKPSTPMFASALDGLAPAVRVAVVGESPTTDILAAHRAGLAGILVAPEPVHSHSARDFRRPDAVIPDISGLFDPAIALRRWIAPGFPRPDDVRPGVAAVVLDAASRVLLARPADNGLWGLPSGHAEPGETVGVRADGAEADRSPTAAVAHPPGRAAYESPQVV